MIRAMRRMTCLYINNCPVKKLGLRMLLSKIKSFRETKSSQSDDFRSVGVMTSTQCTAKQKWENFNTKRPKSKKFENQVTIWTEKKHCAQEKASYLDKNETRYAGKGKKSKLWIIEQEKTPRFLSAKRNPGLMKQRIRTQWKKREGKQKQERKERMR